MTNCGQRDTLMTLAAAPGTAANVCLGLLVAPAARHAAAATERILRRHGVQAHLLDTLGHTANSPVGSRHLNRHAEVAAHEQQTLLIVHLSPPAWLSGTDDITRLR